MARTFEWDPGKATANLTKHVSFNDAATTFRDPLARIHDDPDHSASEHREIIVGLLPRATPRGGLSLSAGVTSVRSAPGLHAASVATMKKRSRAARGESDDLRPEYGFDYPASRPNPYAESLKGRAIAVVLDPRLPRPSLPPSR
jgi:uncharacterized DUF497 family protein